MAEMMDRRRFLQGALQGGAAAVGFAQINPDFLISSAFAQAGKPLVFLSAENITGNWDPTAHTTLSQKNIEGFVMVQHAVLDDHGDGRGCDGLGGSSTPSGSLLARMRAGGNAHALRAARRSRISARSFTSSGTGTAARP